MAVEAETVRYPYVGDGSSTVFSFPSKFLSNSDIRVGVNGSEVLSGFTTSGAGNELGGTVTFTVAPAIGAAIDLFRDPPVSQLTSFEDAAATLGNTLENTVDKLTMIAQTDKDSIGRSLRRSDFGSDGYDAQGFRVVDVGDPVDQQDVATRYFVETAATSQVAQATEAAAQAIQALAAISDVAPGFNIFPDTTNQTAIFQALLNSAAGKTLRTRSGVYLVGALTVPAGVRWEFDPGAILMRHPSVTFAGETPLLGIAGDDIQLVGVTIDLNSPTANTNVMVGIGPTAGRKRIRLEDITVKNGAFKGINWTGGPGRAWLHESIDIIRPVVDNVGWTGVYVDNVQGGSVVGGHFTRTGTDAITVSGVDGFTVDGNYIDNYSVAQPDKLYTGPGSFGSTWSGFAIQYQAYSKNLTISNNTIKGNPLFDTIGLGDDGVNVPQGIRIFGNTIERSAGWGIDVSANCVCFGNVVKNANQGAIALAQDFGGLMENIVVTGNIITNPGYSGFIAPGIITGNPVPRTTNLTTTNGSTAATVADGSLLAVGALVAATGITAGTKIAAKVGNALTLTAPATSTATRTATFTPYTVFKNVLISGNVVNDDRGTPYTFSGIGLSDLDCVSYENFNVVDNNFGSITGVLAARSYPTGTFKPGIVFMNAGDWAWTSSAPGVAPTGGAFGTSPTTALRFKNDGKAFSFEGSITIGTVGTATGDLFVAMPTVVKAAIPVAVAAINRTTKGVLYAEVSGSGMIIAPGGGFVAGHVYSFAGRCETV